MTLTFPSGFESEVWTDSNNGGTITKIGYSDQLTHTLAMADATSAGYTIGAAHPTQTTYLLSSRSVTPLGVDETVPGTSNKRHYRVTLEYSNQTPTGISAGDEIWTIQIQQQSARISTVDGYQLVNGTPTSKPQNNYPTTNNPGDVIGWTSDGEEEGCDAYRPIMAITCQKAYGGFEYTDPDGIPWNYIKAYSFPKPCYNSAAMTWDGLTFGSGELLFLGAAYAKQNGQHVVTYQFQATPWSTYSVKLYNLSTSSFYAATIGPSGTNLIAMPWDHVWLAKKEIVDSSDPSNKQTQKWNTSVHAATIYDAANLNNLGLTGPGA